MYLSQPPIMDTKISLQLRAQVLSVLARAALETPLEPLLWRHAPVWRDFFFSRWHYGDLIARFDGDLRLVVDLSDHIECMIYLHEMQQGDRGLVRFLKRLWRPGDVVLDVGANIGVFSLLAAKRVRDRGRVIAFEPVERNIARFMQNMKLNVMGQVELQAIALSNRDGSDHIFLPTHNNAGMCSLHRVEPSDLEQTVTLRRLDTYVASARLDRIDSIKVDIEGHEAAFLEGAAETLETYRPTVCMELSRPHLQRAGSNPLEILESMQFLRYAVYGLDIGFGHMVILSMRKGDGFYSALNSLI